MKSIHLPGMEMTTVRSEKLKRNGFPFILWQLWLFYFGSTHIKHRRDTDCRLWPWQMCHFQFISVHRRAPWEYIVIQFHWHPTHDTATASTLLISTKIYIAIVKCQWQRHAGSVLWDRIHERLNEKKRREKSSRNLTVSIMPTLAIRICQVIFNEADERRDIHSPTPSLLTQTKENDKKKRDWAIFVGVTIIQLSAYDV